MMPCQCGHKSHTGRCQPAPFGCPCHKYTPAENVAPQPASYHIYYRGEPVRR